MSRPVVSVLYAPGTNSHQETMWAFERVGAEAKLLFLSDVLSGNARLDATDALCIPGGFAHGDHLGAGQMAGVTLREKFGDQLAAVATKPVIAICNGFQIAVKAGLFGPAISLAVNESGTFQNIPEQPHVVTGECAWLEGMSGTTIRFPCAHGEGRFVRNEGASGWRPVLGYPAGQNPDGSVDDIAGIATDNGLVFGLMDHPERAPHTPGTMDIFANGVAAMR
jgi:phosphoribosylformylglycinamidine synthase subunit PurQ / glutaminase